MTFPCLRDFYLRKIDIADTSDWEKEKKKEKNSINQIFQFAADIKRKKDFTVSKMIREEKWHTYLAIIEISE